MCTALAGEITQPHAVDDPDFATARQCHDFELQQFLEHTIDARTIDAVTKLMARQHRRRRDGEGRPKIRVSYNHQRTNVDDRDEPGYDSSALY